MKRVLPRWLAALLLAAPALLTGCRLPPPCALPEGEPAPTQGRQVARPGLDAALRKCLDANGVRPADGEEGQVSAWEFYVVGDNSALPNAAKIGALLFFERVACDPCGEEQIVRALAAVLDPSTFAAAEFDAVEIPFLQEFLAALLDVRIGNQSQR